jgi:hypothetical protein
MEVTAPMRLRNARSFESKPTTTWYSKANMSWCGFTRDLTGRERVSTHVKEIELDLQDT